MDVKFNSKDDLENWLRNQRVEEAKAGEAAEILFSAGFDNSDTLAGITSQQLQASGIRVPLAVYLSNRLPSPQQLQEQQNENIAHGVFVLYRGDDKDAEPIGTAFAISPKLLLTACQNVVVPATEEGGESVVSELKVTSKLIKSGGKVTTIKNADGTHERGTPVSVYRYNRPVDWACLKHDDEDNAFPFIITVGTQASDVPQPTTREKLFIYHCPVQLFLDDDEIDACHVMVKEASVGIINQKTLNYQNGAFPGSCGGPYIFRNKAVALHVDSVSTTKTADALRNEKATTSSGRKRKLTTAETALMVADSCASSHSSLGMGILLYVRSAIMDLLQE